MIFAAAMLMFGSCKNNSAISEKPVITVSIEPQRWLLERIVGDHMEVRTLMARGGNPENYEPAFSHLADLEKSLCYMKMGNLGFETAIVSRISANIPDLKIVNTSDSIDLIVDDDGHDHGIDPHVWSSARNARIISRNMLRTVSELDPRNADDYKANFINLSHTIDSIDSVCAVILAPLNNRSFLVRHPSLSYFARDYNLEQISVGAEGKEHSIPDTRDVLKKAAESNASVYLIQQDFDASKASGLIGESLRVVSINPLNYDWPSELLHTADAIAGR